MATAESSVASSPTGVRKWPFSFFFGGGNASCLLCGVGAFGDSWVFEPALSATGSALPTVVESGQPVAFSSSAAGGSAPYSYLWQFGDGSSAFGTAPVHSYGWANVFSAQLTVTDASGATTSTTVLITSVGGPSVSVTVQPLTTDIGRPVAFVGLVGGGTSPYSYRWSFGDLAGATSLDATHNYSLAGHFPVNLSVTDTVQGHGIAFGNVTVNALPDLTAVASNLTPSIGTNVSFSGSVVGGTAPFSFTWELGDGTGSAAAAFSHAYATPGTYLVTASVVDSVGAVSWENFTVVVAAPGPGPGPGSNSSPGLTSAQWLGIGLLLLGAVLAIVTATLLLLRHRRREPPSLAAAPVGQSDWDGDDADSPATSRTARRSLNRFYRRRS
jgi:PKD repeat protein